MAYDADDVYWLLENLNLARKIDDIKSNIESLTSQIDKIDAIGKGELFDLQQVLSDHLSEKPEPKTSSLELDTVTKSLDSISLVSNHILEVVERPDKDNLVWPPLLGQIVTLQGWDYPHVVKAVEVEDGAVKYLVGASTRRDDPRDVSVRLCELVPHRW
ncbi:MULTISPECIES: hypothetical protein [Pseudomonas]|uniref:hypothetical protein n=1 Tax=Pseudomonas TaxID=286 RepID=UPI0012D4AD2C|nr:MULTISPECIES: hypothetical protein [Pseudomonas]